MDTPPLPDSDVTATTEMKASFGQMLFGHAVLLIFCVGLPALFTAVAPLTVTNLEREQRTVTAHVSKRVLFIIPYSTSTIQDVTTVGDTFVSGKSSRTNLPSGGSRTTQTEDSAFLTIEGANGTARVEVSPVNIKSVQERTAAFVADPAQTHLRLITVANWKFGVFCGGLLSLLTVFYVYLQLGSLWRMIRGR